MTSNFPSCLIVLPAVREDRYFIAGRAVAVCLVHGGPPPHFFSNTLYDCIVKGPDRCNPVLEDVADFELRDQLTRVSSSHCLFYCVHRQSACINSDTLCVGQGGTS